MIKYNFKYNYIGDIIMKRDAVVLTRKWGNSIGVVLPKDITDEEKIHENEKIVISVKKVAQIKDLFGAAKEMKKIKKTTQEMKNEIREGWG